MSQTGDAILARLVEAITRDHASRVLGDVLHDAKAYLEQRQDRPKGEPMVGSVDAADLEHPVVDFYPSPTEGDTPATLWVDRRG